MSRRPARDFLRSHGDDLTTVDPKSSLDWFKAKLDQKYELKEAARLGPGNEDDKDGRVLNRIVRWTENVLEYEGGQRQVEMLLQEL